MHLSVYYLTKKSFGYFNDEELFTLRTARRWYVSIDIPAIGQDEIYSYTRRFVTKPTRKQVSRCKRDALDEFNWMYNEGK